MSKQKQVIAIAAAVSLALAGGIYAWSSFIAASESEPQPEIRPVKTVVVDWQAGGEQLMQTGEVRAARETDLSFRLPGKLLRREVEVGARVDAGATLAVLEDTDVRNELRVAQAELASSASSLALARTEMERSQRLLLARAASKSQVDEAVAQFEAAAARRDAAQANVEAAGRRLAYTRLVAASAGVVTAVGANSGENVAAGQMVVRVAEGAGRDAVFDVSEQVLNSTPESVVVSVSLLSDPAIVAIGRVREVSPSADPVTRTYRVKVQLENPPEAMTIGAVVSGRVDVPTGRVVRLPAAALSRSGDDPALFVVDPATGRLSLVKVSVARYAADVVYVEEGLQDGQQVVVAGVSKLRPDQVVRVEEEVR